MEPILCVENLAKAFDGVTAVKGISFSIQPGEIFGLLGPNGSGKTTTIQMLMGVLTPDRGQISVFGKPLRQHREEILKQMNFSSSYVSLPWNLTVEENLRVFARLYGVPDYGTRSHDLLETFELTPFRKTLTGKLSSGQLTRLFLVKALLNQPRLLLLDEPTASLDPDIADRTRQTLMQLSAEQGVAMLYTSHNMAEISLMCRRIAFLHHGRILAEGSPDELTHHFGKKDLEQVFLHIARDHTPNGSEELV